MPPKKRVKLTYRTKKKVKNESTCGTVKNETAQRQKAIKPQISGKPQTVERPKDERRELLRQLEEQHKLELRIRCEERVKRIRAEKLKQRLQCQLKRELREKRKKEPPTQNEVRTKEEREDEELEFERQLEERFKVEHWKYCQENERLKKAQIEKGRIERQKYERERKKRKAEKLKRQKEQAKLRKEEVEDQIYEAKLREREKAQCLKRRNEQWTKRSQPKEKKDEQLWETVRQLQEELWDNNQDQKMPVEQKANLAKYNEQMASNVRTYGTATQNLERTRLLANPKQAGKSTEQAPKITVHLVHFQGQAPSQEGSRKLCGQHEIMFKVQQTENGQKRLCATVPLCKNPTCPMSNRQSQLPQYSKENCPAVTCSPTAALSKNSDGYLETGNLIEIIKNEPEDNGYETANFMEIPVIKKEPVDDVGQETKKLTEIISRRNKRKKADYIAIDYCLQFIDFLH